MGLLGAGQRVVARLAPPAAAAAAAATAAGRGVRGRGQRLDDGARDPARARRTVFLIPLFALGDVKCNF